MCVCVCGVKTHTGMPAPGRAPHCPRACPPTRCHTGSEAAAAHCACRMPQERERERERESQLLCERRKEKGERRKEKREREKK